MSADKRRRARVQGGWSSGLGSSQQPRKSTEFNSKVKTTSDVAVPSFSYVKPQPNSDEMRRAPDLLTINKCGVYEVSNGPSGVSRIQFWPDFIARSETSWMYEQLMSEIPWVQKTEMQDGVEVAQPRMVAWFGDVPYSYSGVSHKPNNQWSPLLVMLKEMIEEKVGTSFNSMLANLYRNGKDSVAWHCDDEPELKGNPTIASLSFGETRDFELRKKPPPVSRVS
ncbi:PREDICTED: alpha-ketoglutarate-dependent dioxygenase alkB homolog 3-like isoform X4 [Priapulus caudatus]|uniref:Alpha-ketoglutarate-dependent dioxygenase alkB homolog 3-like isoform X4 n=1 Tax=Priapulus caudatus TaxID=37621 RepID=A0ABM1EYQ9_PRICU|nr:PREDICTED: alpha-ketoglutarate-dependent dioxygenase alkB homolog 3-like isoform X4 [Priapulus caudatus]